MKIKTILKSITTGPLLSLALILISLNAVIDSPAPNYMMSGGTGYFITNDGYLLTNRHVVIDSHSDEVLLEYHGALRTAKIVFVSADRDIAVLKVDSSTPCLRIAQNSTLKSGDAFQALIMDRRNGQDFMKAKWITLESRVLTIMKDMQFSQFPTVHYPNFALTPPFSRPGNSGSPVINPKTHEVTGMVYGGGGMNFGGFFTVYLYSLLLQSGDINKVVADSGLRGSCPMPTTTPINDTTRILVFIDPDKAKE